jgi:glucan phosphoethanolaminetransferase (alkaline phosphatase superfamily)
MSSSSPSPKFPVCLSFCGVRHSRVLFYLAFLIWFIGAWACGDSTNTLYSAASLNGATTLSLSISLSIGLFIGCLAAYYWFIPLAMNNIDRIHKLEEPRVYEFLRPRFLVGLTLLDGTTVMLTYFLAKNVPSQLFLVSVNAAVCVALSVSCFVYLSRIRETCTNSKSQHETDNLNSEKTSSENLLTSNLINNEEMGIPNDR